MATLKELYTTLKSLRDMNLPIDDKLIEAADRLEKKIINEDILPALEQNIEPLANEIQRRKKKDYMLLLSDAFTGLSIHYHDKGNNDNYFALSDIGEQIQDIIDNNKELAAQMNDLIDLMVNYKNEGIHKQLIDAHCMIAEWIEK